MGWRLSCIHVGDIQIFPDLHDHGAINTENIYINKVDAAPYWRGMDLRERIKESVKQDFIVQQSTKYTVS